MLMAYEVTRDWPVATRLIHVPDPVSSEPSSHPIAAPVLDPQFEPVIVPILRAGLPLAEGIMTVLPDAPMGHIGVQRQLESAELDQYLVALPALEKQPMFILVDPVVGTGNAARQIIEGLHDNVGIPYEAIRFVTLLISPKGVEELAQVSDVRIYAASVEDKLSRRDYVEPGFGNAANRLYG